MRTIVRVVVGLVGLFNVVLGLKLEPREKEALVQYMLAI